MTLTHLDNPYRQDTDTFRPHVIQRHITSEVLFPTPNVSKEFCDLIFWSLVFQEE